MQLNALCNPPAFSRRVLTKTLRIMKLTAILLFAASMLASAKGSSQITLSETNTPLQKVFKKIQQQSGYDFLFSYELLQQAGKVSVKVNNVTLQQAVEECLKGKGLTYEIVEKTVVIKKETVQLFINVDAPPKTIKGKVTDADGKVLPGATVTIIAKNKIEGFTNIAVKTDEFGDFAITVPSGNYTISISYVGYKLIEKEITVREKNLNEKFVMANEYSQIQSVEVKVNTGYQQISNERVTGAFDNIKKEQIQKPAVGIAERLIGTTAGLEVKIDVNGLPNIRLRGQTTLNANNVSGVTGDNNPLVVVDGFPIQSLINNPYGGINPNDIETITVLKDAAAASIWGARSSNGVIVITTKKANKNTPLKVEFSAFTRFSPKADVRYLTGQSTAAEAIDYVKMAYKKWGGYVNPGTLSNKFRQSEAYVALSENNLGFLTTDQMNARLTQLSGLDNTRQIADFLLENPRSTQYNLSLSGGGERMTNFLTMMAEQTQSHFKESKNQRYVLGYRTNANLFPWLDFDLSGNFQYQKNVENGIGAVDIQNLSPYEMLKNPDGTLTDIHQYYQPILDRLVPLSKFPYSFRYNPIEEIANRDRTTKTYNTRVSAGLTFKLLKGLTFNSRVQYENIGINIKYIENDQTFAVRNQINSTSTWNQTLAGTVTRNLPLGSRINSLQRSGTDAFIFRNIVNFSRTFGSKHDIDFVAGSDVSKTTSQRIDNPPTYGYNDNTLAVGIFPNGATGTTGWEGFNNNFSYTNSFGYSTQRFFSMFANAAYTYLDKYTLSASYRTDASNLIARAPKYRYSPFYSMGVGYAISKEGFMQNISWINRLNLRATYGRTGNVDRSTSPYTLLNLRASPDPYTQDYIATISNPGNPTLTWEKTKTINIGIDYSLFRNKLFGKVDVYNKQGIDLLASISIPSVNGTSTAFFNNAGLQNRGIEVTLGTSLPSKSANIGWNGSLNFSYNRSKITELFKTPASYSGLIFGGSNAYREGYHPATAWAFEYAGVGTDGRPKVYGPDKTLLNLTDNKSGDIRSYVQNAGTFSPPYLFGMTNSFKVYDFNLSFIITAKFGAVFRRELLPYISSTSSSFIGSRLGEVLNADPSKIVPLPSNPNDFTYNSYFQSQYLTYNFVSADLARLQELNLSYNVPRRVLSKLNIRNAQLILQGNNLYTWLANDAKEDPEYLKRSIRPRALYTFGVKIEL
ncbi:MAG: SusC/RagA family TonB-linked outer membrane protein [Ferruginibacter sp.]|nr:SusC/RagA family TonB-linked outer membrane protein [Ferruginibacter sp.]